MWEAAREATGIHCLAWRREFIALLDCRTAKQGNEFPSPHELPPTYRAIWVQFARRHTADQRNELASLHRQSRPECNSSVSKFSAQVQVAEPSESGHSCRFCHA